MIIIIPILVIVLVLVGGIIGKRVYDYWNKPINVKLAEVARINTDKDLGNGGYWSMVYGRDHSISKEYGISIPEVDFSKYNLIFVTGRELKQLTYKRGETLPYGDKVYKGNPIFKRELNPHTIFFYRVEKISIHEDDFSKPEEMKLED